MYDSHYGFTDRPFQLTPDPRFWFESRTHRAAMAYLGYGLAQGEGFIVITGEVGAGKTTLVGHLMGSVDRKRLNVIQLVSTQVEGDDVLRLVAQAMGLTSEGLAKAQVLNRIERGLRVNANNGQRTLLIVDEAQNLSFSALEELRMLSNFQNGGHALLQVFLLGQPEFRERFQQSEQLEQLRQRVIATHHLTAMDEGEIEPYVRHRLEVAGWQGDPSFADDVWPALHRHSGGVPRRLNMLAGRVLLHGAIETLDRIDGAAVELVAGDMADERDIPDGANVARPGAAGSAGREPRADHEIRARLASLEERLDEQEAAIRRVLTLLIDWVERDEPIVAPRHKTAR